MTTRPVLLLLLMSISLWAVSAHAQSNQTAAERVDNLKLQLIDVKAREESAKLHLEQLDEALKPENIERSVSGFGSTRPEELREQRRRQLTIEKTRVTAELDQLASQRARLESAIGLAEVQAYHESASGTTPVGNGFLGMSRATVRRLIIASVVGVMAIVLFVGLLLRRALARNARLTN